MIKEIISNTADETLKLGIELGKASEPGSVFALYGELGTGKTIIAKGIAKGMGINEDVTSPTFLLLEEYFSDRPLYHFDLYRIKSPGEFDELNFEEYWAGEGVSVIEWADKAGRRIPADSVKIYLEWIDESRRKILIEYPDN